jgi:transcriptional/translational regulatory protein YebC/TACO1
MMNQFIQALQNIDLSSDIISQTLIEIMVNDPFSQQPQDWNTLLRELEQFDDIADVYHQVSAQDLAQWFS